MLLKLLKYDFRSTAPKILITCALFIILCIILPFFMLTFGFTQAMVYSCIALWLGAIALSVLVIIFLFQHYNRSLYSNEGYLLFTLPAKGRTILLSKILTAFIWNIISSLLCIIALLVFGYVMSKNPEIGRVLKETIKRLDFSASKVFLYISLLLVNDFAFFIEIYFSITFSKLTVFRRCGVLMGFVAYFGIQIVKCLAGIVVGLNNQEIGKETAMIIIHNDSPAVSISTFFNSIYSWASEGPAILISIVIIVALFIVGSWLIEKHTSLK